MINSNSRKMTGIAVISGLMGCGGTSTPMIIDDATPPFQLSEQVLQTFETPAGVVSNVVGYGRSSFDFYDPNVTVTGTVDTAAQTITLAEAGRPAITLPTGNIAESTWSYLDADGKVLATVPNAAVIGGNRVSVGEYGLTPQILAQTARTVRVTDQSFQDYGRRHLSMKVRFG